MKRKEKELEKRDFDKEAASWDETPARVKWADDVAHAISDRLEFDAK